MTKAHQIAKLVMRRLAELRIDDAIVSISQNNKTQIKFVDNNVVSCTNWDLAQVDVFMHHKGKVAQTTVDSLDERAILNAVETLQRNSRYLPVNKDFAGIAKGPFRYKKVRLSHDKRIENLGSRAKDIVDGSIALALKEGAQRVSGNFEFGSGYEYLLSSSKTDAEDKGTHAYLSIRAFTDKDASGHKTACSRMLGRLEHKYAASTAGRFASESKNPVDIESGHYDIIFDPMAFSVLLDNVASACSAFSVDAGLSFFRKDLGKKVANENVTLVDDGTLANGYGSTKFDAEGVPTRKNVMIDRGNLRTFLHNSSTAKKYRTKTTANAGLVSPEPWNTILAPGKLSKESLFKSVDKGLYITNLWYTRYQNHATGDFSTIPRDAIFVIENGQIKKSAKGIRISDNMRRILMNIDGISRSPEQVVGWETEKPVVTPFVLVRGVNISKSIQ